MKNLNFFFVLFCFVFLFLKQLTFLIKKSKQKVKMFFSLKKERMKKIFEQNILLQYQKYLHVCYIWTNAERTSRWYNKLWANLVDQLIRGSFYK